MKRLISSSVLLVLIATAAFAQAVQPVPASNVRVAKGDPGATALDRYIGAPDASYKYEVINKTVGSNYTTFIVDMTSQTWRSTNEVDRNVWRHWMMIIKPNEVKSSKSLLFISGGNNNSPAPKDADPQMIQLATTTKSVVTELRMVPNQPLTFSDDKKPRTEDEMIAYTWDKFLKTGEDMWPARLPMTKSAVRAMDTVQSVLKSDAGGNTTIDGFIVAGASKRGWTTWTTAIVDKRVVAIIPIVIDMLNVEPSFRHHFASYGYYAPAVGDYEELKIMSWQGTPQYRNLMKIEEPYEYRNRLTMPKFIINATGDQFFLPDSWQFYWNDLPGVKHLRYVPNAEHSMRGSDAFMTVLACYNSVITGATLPDYSWSVDKDGTIKVKTTTKPNAVKLWQATNPGARDFRVTSIGPKWTSTNLEDKGNGEYVAKLAPPKKGYTAYMVELTFPSGLALAPYKFTSGVKVIPDVEPFKDDVPPAVKP